MIRHAQIIFTYADYCCHKSFYILWLCFRLYWEFSNSSRVHNPCHLGTLLKTFRYIIFRWYSLEWNSVEMSRMVIQALHIFYCTFKTCNYVWKLTDFCFSSEYHLPYFLFHRLISFSYTFKSFSTLQPNYSCVFSIDVFVLIPHVFFVAQQFYQTPCP